MLNARPSLFIGSSSEGLPIAQALQVNLDKICDTVIWSQGVFGLSQGTLETLVEEIPGYDFAILVMTPDDMSESRGETKQAARDNVLLEFGLCAGILGRKRTFAVYDRKSKMRIPSDLAGITLADYQLHKNGNIIASLGAASTKIESEILKLGPRTNGVKEIPDSVFLAVPMNAFNVAGRAGEYKIFRKKILSLIAMFKKECGIKKVFCAIEEVPDVEEFDLPGASLALDMDEVLAHQFFMLICLKDVGSSSILIETGMALAMGKPCIICIEQGARLPFILQDAPSAVQNVKKIEFKTLDKLKSEIKRNKSWIFKVQNNKKSHLR